MQFKEYSLLPGFVRLRRLHFFALCVTVVISIAVNVIHFLNSGLYRPMNSRTPLVERISVDELHRLAKDDNVDAQRRLGDAYWNGDGVERQLTEAFRWYLLAAEAGDPDSQQRLSRMYAYGYGVTQDLAMASEWAARAAASSEESRR